MNELKYPQICNLSTLSMAATECANRLLETACERTTTGNYVLNYSTVADLISEADYQKYFSMIGSEFGSCEAVLDLTYTSDYQFDAQVNLDFCPHAIISKSERKETFGKDYVPGTAQLTPKKSLAELAEFRPEDSTLLGKVTVHVEDLLSAADDMGVSVDENEARAWWAENGKGFLETLTGEEMERLDIAMEDYLNNRKSLPSKSYNELIDGGEIRFFRDDTGAMMPGTENDALQKEFALYYDRIPLQNLHCHLMGAVAQDKPVLLAYYEFGEVSDFCKSNPEIFSQFLEIKVAEIKNFLPVASVCINCRSANSPKDELVAMIPMTDLISAYVGDERSAANIGEDLSALDLSITQDVRPDLAVITLRNRLLADAAQQSEHVPSLSERMENAEQRRAGVSKSDISTSGYNR